MRGIAPAAVRLRGEVGLAYAPASQASDAVRRVSDLLQALKPGEPDCLLPDTALKPAA